MKDKDKRKVKWNSLLQVTDISPRKKADWIYCLLYTNIGVSVCSSEKLGAKLCLFQDYEMRGYVNFCKGGTYLVVEKAERFNPEKYQRTD